LLKRQGLRIKNWERLILAVVGIFEMTESEKKEFEKGSDGSRGFGKPKLMLLQRFNLH